MALPGNAGETPCRRWMTVCEPRCRPPTLRGGWNASEPMAGLRRNTQLSTRNVERNPCTVIGSPVCPSTHGTACPSATVFIRRRAAVEHRGTPDPPVQAPRRAACRGAPWRPCGGTRCSRRAFMRSAGTVQSRASKSSSRRVRPCTSPDRATVRIANATACTPESLRWLNFVRNAAICRRGRDGWCSTCLTLLGRGSRLARFSPSRQPITLAPSTTA